MIEIILYRFTKILGNRGVLSCIFNPLYTWTNIPQTRLQIFPKKICTTVPISAFEFKEIVGVGATCRTVFVALICGHVIAAIPLFPVDFPLDREHRESISQELLLSRTRRRRWNAFEDKAAGRDVRVQRNEIWWRCAPADFCLKIRKDFCFATSDRSREFRARVVRNRVKIRSGKSIGHT